MQISGGRVAILLTILWLKFCEYDQIYDYYEHYSVSMTKNYDNNKPYLMTEFEHD